LLPRSGLSRSDLVHWPITEVMQAASDVRSTPHNGHQLYPLIAAAVNKVKRLNRNPSKRKPAKQL
jgi:hypothetical protein